MVAFRKLFERATVAGEKSPLWDQVRQACEALGLASPNGVQARLVALRRRGIMQNDATMAKSWVVVGLQDLARSAMQSAAETYIRRIGHGDE